MKRLLVLALSLGLGACASTGAVPRPFPVPAARDGNAKPTAPAAPAPPETVRAGELGYAVTSTALSFRGVPYRNGGTDPTGFDCSGLVKYVFDQHGFTLPRESRQQFAAGEAVELDQVVAGDLVFFSTVAPGASHVGIALGGDQFVHAPSSQGVVRVERLSAPYWASRFVGARRVR